MKKIPTAEQLRALLAWANEHPGNWKAALDKAWLMAGAGVRSYTPELQQVRNEFGPSWLQRQTITTLRAALEAALIDPNQADTTAPFAAAVTETLSDGSTAHNVRLRIHQQGSELSGAIVFACATAGHARVLAETINACAWIEGPE